MFRNKLHNIVPVFRTEVWATDTNLKVVRILMLLLPWWWMRLPRKRLGWSPEEHPHLMVGREGIHRTDRE